MSACTFFGHRDCYGLDVSALRSTIEGFIHQSIDTFYVGNQGQFDGIVYNCLKQLRNQYPHIRVCVVLAYLPTQTQEYEDLSDTMYPEIEGHPKFAIDRRNRWMLNHADFCICYINHTWGGAFQYAKLAASRGKTVVNLGKATMAT